MDFGGTLTVLWNIIKMITIFDVLDVTIISFIFYKIITFVRKTNSTNIIKGILLLIAILGLSRVLKLRVLNYLLNSAFEIGIVAIIVLFQPRASQDS